VGLVTSGGLGGLAAGTTVIGVGGSASANVVPIPSGNGGRGGAAGQWLPVRAVNASRPIDSIASCLHNSPSLG